VGSIGSDLAAGSPSRGRLGAVAARWPIAFLLWLTPSVGQLLKFAGRPGAVLLIGAAAVGIALTLAWALAPSDRPRAEPPWHLLIAIALCVIFAVAYPVATSGLFGGGTDRADALDVTDAALFAGRPVYDTLTYLGNPPTPLPGAVLLAAPFHLIGSAALQNVFWFLVLCALAPRIVGDGRGGAAYLAILVLGCPGVLLDFATGSDFATNAIYVIVSVWLLTSLAPAETWAVRGLACALFACALSSRPIYVVEAPIVAAAVLQRQGLRRCLEVSACVAILLAVIDGPLLAGNPTRFPLMLHANLLGFWPRWLHATIAIPALSLAIAGSALFVGTGRGRLWLLSAVSLAPMLAPLFVFVVLRRGLGPWLVIDGGYTLPLALFGGLWLLRAPQARSPSEPAGAALAPAPR
jgi:hypothetical protein